jgi:hypothetical protein
MNFLQQQGVWAKPSPKTQNPDARPTPPKRVLQFPCFLGCGHATVWCPLQGNAGRKSLASLEHGHARGCQAVQLPKDADHHDGLKAQLLMGVISPMISVPEAATPPPPAPPGSCVGTAAPSLPLHRSQ